MKQLSFEVLKKNRKYFAIKLQGGFECKLLIDELSQDLVPGNYNFLCEDISVRTKYGTDVIYKLFKAEAVEPGKIVTLKHRYNALLVEECRKLGGKWDADCEAWVFSSIVANEVERLDEIFNSPEVIVEITPKSQYGIEGYRESVKFLGYEIAKATGRDSGARLGEGVAMLEGRINSGGSMKNWKTVIDSGSRFRLLVPRLVLERESSGWNFEVISEGN